MSTVQGAAWYLVERIEFGGQLFATSATKLATKKYELKVGQAEVVFTVQPGGKTVEFDLANSLDPLYDAWLPLVSDGTYLERLKTERGGTNYIVSAPPDDCVVLVIHSSIYTPARVQLEWLERPPHIITISGYKLKEYL